MAAPQKVSTAQVREAIERWRGNIVAAASDLGLSANALRERVDRLGIDLAAARHTIPSGAALPIKVKPIRHVPMRVPPVIEERIRHARFDLCARYHVEITDEAVLAQLVEDTIGPWLAAKLEPKS